MPHTLRDAAKAVGRDRSTLVRAIRAGRLSATRDAATGAWLIEPSEWHRVYPPEPAAGDAERMNNALGSAIVGRPIGRHNGAQAAAQVEIRESAGQPPPTSAASRISAGASMPRARSAGG